MTVKEGSSVSITLEDGSEGMAFDAQSVVVESGASLSVTMTNNTSLMPEQDDGASTVSTFAESDSGLTLEEGAKLEVIVPSGRVDLSEVFTDASDFSNVTFEVDGLLVLPSTIEAEELKDKVSGSGNVLISSDEGGNTGTFYAIEDGNLKESEETVILGDIKVYTDNDEQVTENDNLGYTWTKETYIVDENGNLTGPVDGGDGTTGDDALNGNKANVNLFVQSPISPNPTDGNDSSLPSNAGEENTNDDTTNTASDDTIDVWTLTILRPNVVGDITIVQEVGTVPNGNDYMGIEDEDEYYETVAAAQEKYMAAFEETNMEFTASTDCTVYGEVKVLYGGRLEGVTGPEYMEHESFPIPYTKTVGTLTFSGEYEMNVAYDISYGNAMVKVANTLTAASINTWKLELLETADLTLWQGAQLTTNNSKTRLLSGVQKEHHDEEWGNPALQEEYEQRIRKEFLARIENVLTIQDGAKYTYPATGVSPFYIMVNMVKYFDYDNEEDKERRVLINVFDEESYEELITPKIIEWEDGEHTLSEEWIELPVVDDYVDEWTNEKVEIIYSEEMDEDQKEAAEKALESVITVGNTFYVVFSEADLKSAFTIPDDMYDEMVGGGDYPLVLQCDAKLQKLGDTNGVFSLSIQRPPADGEEAGIDGGNGGSSSSSSSGGSGSPLPTVDPDGGDGSETGGNETDGSSPDSGCSQPSNCVSDTLGTLTVNGSYQFKLTSTDGTVPTLTVDGSAFRVGSVSQDGNDYYVKIYAVGAPGAAGDVRVNGVKVVEAAVGSVYGGVLSDTTAPFTVRQGEAYQFRLTSDAMPVMTAGSSSFRVEYAGNIGRDWFYKVYAVGQVGDGCGFYVNDAPFPTAIAHITKPES